MSHDSADVGGPEYSIDGIAGQDFTLVVELVEEDETTPLDITDWSNWNLELRRSARTDDIPPDLSLAPTGIVLFHVDAATTRRTQRAPFVVWANDGNGDRTPMLRGILNFGTSR